MNSSQSVGLTNQLMAKADAKVLNVEKLAALTALDAHPHAAEDNGNPEQRSVDALQNNTHQTVLETLGNICADLPLEQKLSLLRNCCRVAISDEELRMAHQKMIVALEEMNSRKQVTD